jgi:hypothetical protein
MSNEKVKPNNSGFELGQLVKVKNRAHTLHGQEGEVLAAEGRTVSVKMETGAKVAFAWCDLAKA